MAFRTDAPTIPLEALEWDAIGDPEDELDSNEWLGLPPPSIHSILNAHIRIGPLDMHLTAIEIHSDKGGDWLAMDSRCGSRPKQLADLEGVDIFQMIQIERGGVVRDYVLYATPYGA